MRATVIGALLPLCSCGVLPAAFALRRAGASRASTASFLIATPETGVDSVALSWVLLGPVLALIRPLGAVLSAVAIGLAVGAWERRSPAPRPLTLPVQAGPSCEGGACCGCADEELPAGRAHRIGRFAALGDGLRYAFSDLLDDLAGWLAAGILAAGLVVTFLPPDVVGRWGAGLPAMLAILLISVPLYVCATASTSLAHGLLFAGVSPGTLLVFLLAGPATNLAGLALVRKELGGRATSVYLGGILVSSLLLGLGLDAFLAALGWHIAVVAPSSAQGLAEGTGWLAWLSLSWLLMAAVRPIRRRRLGR